MDFDHEHFSGIFFFITFRFIRSTFVCTVIIDLKKRKEKGLSEKIGIEGGNLPFYFVFDGGP